ncbi:hypothetical protein LCGC14_0790930 [marine sediment metagenome]|uniref:Uncharacterized protein n=1 Tax=marine sediment metagenome TaxID=412755 RepID=A0A0F9SCH9_9ZZZZ
MPNADIIDLTDIIYDRANGPFTVVVDTLVTGDVCVVPNTVLLNWADGTVPILPEHHATIRPLLEMLAWYIRNDYYDRE